MNPERATAPDHRDPRAAAGLTARRRARGLPVGRAGLAGPHYLDATGEREVVVGDRLVVAPESDRPTVIALRDEGNEEGGPPQVEVEWPDGFTERYDTRPLDYRSEGPDWPSNWVLDDFDVDTPKGTPHG